MINGTFDPPPMVWQFAPVFGPLILSGKKTTCPTKKVAVGKKLVGQNSPAAKQSLLQRSFSSRGYVTF